METIKLTPSEIQTVERAYYEFTSYKSLMSVLARQLNASANQYTAEMYQHYADLLQKAAMKLALAHDMALAPYISGHNQTRYQFDFIREEARPLENGTP